MDQKIQNFKELRIWQAGIKIVKSVYDVMKSFPKEETYGLVSQLRRSAVSIPSNIAEGIKRNHNKEFKQFLHIAMGSAAELETQLIISQELDFINKDRLQMICSEIEQWNRMTHTLI
jgi:four helix bundle protein